MYLDYHFPQHLIDDLVFSVHDIKLTLSYDLMKVARTVHTFSLVAAKNHHTDGDASVSRYIAHFV